jgi:dUTP pyrophosphatase
LALPSYSHPGDAGMDVRSAIDCEIKPGEVAMVPCGFSIAIPEGYEAQLRPRSGLAAKHNISIPNAPATVDSGYRGAVSVLLANNGYNTFKVNRADRIAQMVFAPVAHAVLVPVAELDETVRGISGFGSSGLR